MVVGSVSRGCEVVVIGGGPGGYVAAIRLGQLGKDVIVVESRERPGGVCLIEGCIPSKAMIHASGLAWEAGHAENLGVTVGEVSVDLPKMVSWKDGIVDKLTGGVGFLFDKAGVEVVRGHARFSSDREVAVETDEGPVHIAFEQAVIASGSSVMPLQGFEVDGERIISSTQALSLEEIPRRLVVIGGGYIGLELGTVYAKLGSEVEVVEFLPELMPGYDREVVRALRKRLKKLGVTLHLNHEATGWEEDDPLSVIVRERESGEEKRIAADRVLVSVGRVPNSSDLGLEEIGLETDDRGFIPVDETMRTGIDGIYAIGDVAGEPLLAHKAYHEAKVAAEVIAGEPAAFDNVAVPAVIYTDPEIAVVGLGEEQAREQGWEVKTGTFPYSASGRAMSLDATDGFVKVVADAETEQLLGVVAVGPGVSELMGEATLALEMGAFLEDVALTIHPHPTLSEAVQEAVEVALGKAVHTVNKKAGKG